MLGARQNIVSEETVGRNCVDGLCVGDHILVILQPVQLSGEVKSVGRCDVLSHDHTLEAGQRRSEGMSDVEKQSWLIGNNGASDIHLSIFVDVISLYMFEEWAIDDVIRSNCSGADVGKINYMCEFGARDSINVAGEGG